MNEQTPIRILLVDDHDMVRRGLAVFLLAYDDFVLVGEATNGAEALEKCAELRPRCHLDGPDDAGYGRYYRHTLDSRTLSAHSGNCPNQL